MKYMPPADEREVEEHWNFNNIGMLNNMCQNIRDLDLRLKLQAQEIEKLHDSIEALTARLIIIK